MASLMRRIREWASRVTGFSTPLGGLSWDSGRAAAEPGGLTDSPVLTPGQCARVLGVDEQVVLDSFESGELHGFIVGGEWRATSAQFAEFLHERSRTAEAEVLVRRISDPREWATALRAQPELLKEIERAEYPADSMGRFLQDSLKGLEDSSPESSKD